MMILTTTFLGFSCNLLKQDMEIMILTATSLDEARSKIEAGLNRLASVLGPPKFNPKERGFVPGAQASFAVVIDGDTLRYALDQSLKSLFLNLATQCETVVCCRVSPAQKALTVKLVRIYFVCVYVLLFSHRFFVWFGLGQGRTKRDDVVDR